MNFKHLLAIPAFLVLLLSSCTSYQYATLSSSLPKSQYNDFFYENDTLQIVFSFAGENCPMQIDIYNKLDEPIYIHWDKTSIIKEGLSIAFKPELAMISNVTIIQNNYVASSGAGINPMVLSANMQLNHTEFIAPKSQICATHYGISSNSLKTNNAIQSERIQLINDSTTAMRHQFSPDNSPLNFGCYITYSGSENSTDSLHHVEGQFWVEDIYKKNIELGIQKDRFYTSELSGFGAFMGLIGLAAWVIIEVTLDDSVEE